MIGQLGWEKIDLTGFSNIWRLCYVYILKVCIFKTSERLLLCIGPDKEFTLENTISYDVDTLHLET